MQKIRLVVAGALGRMGRHVVELARRDDRFQVLAGVIRERTATPSYIPLLTGRNLPRALKEADVLIDFTSPKATMLHLQACVRFGTAAVVGTTGMNDGDLKKIAAAAKRIPVFLSPNMSPAMNLLFALVREASAALKHYDGHVHESHHKQKKDSPSGTALMLAKMARDGSGRAPAISSTRVGDIVGEHTLTLAGPFERLELTHRAHSREVFASGALEAAVWVNHRKPGLYDFSDIMHLGA